MVRCLIRVWTVYKCSIYGCVKGVLPAKFVNYESLQLCAGLLFYYNKIGLTLACLEVYFFYKVGISLLRYW